MLNKKLIYIILIGLCVLTYANSLHNDFISDDLTAIVANPRISQPIKYWDTPHELINCLSYKIAGLNVIPYHVFSVFFHVVSTILVFFLIRLFLDDLSSLMGACLFAVHPIHVEAVSWISGRWHVINAFFVLITYFLYQKSVNTGIEKKRLKVFLYLSSLGIFFYYINKHYPFYIFLPFLLILSDLVFKQWRRSWRMWIPFISIAFLKLIFVMSAVQGRVDIIAFEAAGGGQWRNPLPYFVYSFFSHLWLMLYPVKLRFYQDAVSLTFFNWQIIIGSIAILVLFLFLPFIYKRAKSLFFGLGIFILFLAPTYSPILVTHLVAERYAYLPSIFFSIIFSFCFARLYFKSKKIGKVLVLLIFSSIIMIYAARTILRNEDWKNNQSFWRRELKLSPRSPDAHNNMGVIHIKEGNLSGAIKEFKEAIRLNKNYYNAYNNLGLIYKDLGRIDEALMFFSKAIEVNPRRPLAYYNIGRVYFRFRRIPDAISSFEKAIENNPNYLKAYERLADLYSYLGQKENVVRTYERIIDIDPNNAEVHYNLAVVNFKLNNFDLARKHCDRAVALGYKVESEFLDTLKPYSKP